MFDHKPGKDTRTHNAGHAHDAAGPHAGKHSRVEQELGGQGAGGPTAKLADVGTSATFSTDFASFTQGNVHVSESVSATLSHGEGPLKIDLNTGGFSVGNEHMTVDFKSPGAVTGKHLHVSGASVEVIKNHSSHTGAKIEHGYVGVDYTTSWTVKGTGRHRWTTTFSFSTFVGAKPPHKHHHWWEHIPVVSTVAVAAAAAIAAAAAAVIASSPEWGPIVVVALA
jgi:hypothetical protein